MAAGGVNRVQLLHAAQPAVVVLGLVQEVLRHFRVRQHQEFLLAHGRDDDLGHLLRRQHAVDAGRARAVARHVGRATDCGHRHDTRTPLRP